MPSSNAPSPSASQVKVSASPSGSCPLAEAERHGDARARRAGRGRQRDIGRLVGRGARDLERDLGGRGQPARVGCARPDAVRPGGREGHLGGRVGAVVEGPVVVEIPGPLHEVVVAVAIDDELGLLAELQAADVAGRRPAAPSRPRAAGFRRGPRASGAGRTRRPAHGRAHSDLVLARGREDRRRPRLITIVERAVAVRVPRVRGDARRADREQVRSPPRRGGRRRRCGRTARAGRRRATR